MKLAPGDRVECIAHPRFGFRGIVTEVVSSKFVRVRWDDSNLVVLEGKIELVYWLRKLSLLEVIAEAAAG